MVNKNSNHVIFLGRIYIVKAKKAKGYSVKFQQTFAKIHSLNCAIFFSCETSFPKSILKVPG